MSDLAARYRVPCLQLPHGLMIMGRTDMFTTLGGGVVGTISPGHRERLVAAGLPASCVRDTGDPGSDPLLGRLEATRSSTPSWPAERNQRRVLLLTSSMGMPATTDALPQIDWARAARCVDALRPLIMRHPQWAFSLKCHPRYDHPRLYERINEHLPDDHRIVMTSDPLEALVPAADAVVLLNVVSSALVEASLWARPVMVLDTSMMWFDHEAWCTHAWPRLSTVDDLERTLESILSDPATYDEFVNRTRTALETFFGGPPTPAVPRCLEVIGELASCSSPMAVMGQAR